MSRNRYVLQMLADDLRVGGRPLSPSRGDAPFRSLQQGEADFLLTACGRSSAMTGEGGHPTGGVIVGL